MKDQFVGFGNFSEFIKALDKSRPVNCMSVTEDHPGKQGLVFCISSIVTSQVQDHEVIYHFFVTAQYTKIGNEPLGQTHEERSEKAYELTKEILKEFTLRRSLIAVPKSLKLLQGHNDLLEYIKDDDTFKLKES